MIVTRNIINSRIIYRDFMIGLQLRNYTFEELSQTIDSFKNLLLKKYNCKPGQRILIGTQAGLVQTAFMFAAAELGLVIVIVDYQRRDWIDIDYIDPKTKMLMPIDYFITDFDEKKYVNPKHSWFINFAENTIYILDDLKNNKVIYVDFVENEERVAVEHSLDFTPNDIINSLPDSLLMICTSSGTTGTPKIVQHTHKFIYDLVNRNKFFYYGNVGVTVNLQHGSSFATYFLPAMCSENTEKVFNYKLGKPDEYDASDLDHLMFPYHSMIKTFLNSMKRSPRLNLYTLGYINELWVSMVKRKRVKDIISFFGCNETSGPVFINRINDADFSETRYLKIDEFYKINLDEKGALEVVLPVYEKSVFTNDVFKIENGQYIHLGRNDLIRINDREVDKQNYESKLKELLNADLVYDLVRQRIYLAIWEDDKDLDNKIQQIDDFIKIESLNSHCIDKHSVLKQENFLTGVKLDQELLRDYFRNYYDKRK